MANANKGVLRAKIANHIEKHISQAQRLDYGDWWSSSDYPPSIETRREVYTELADAIIIMVKTEINKEKNGKQKTSIS